MRAVEEKFETEFAKHVPVTFDSEINYFLGVKFYNKRKPNGDVEIKLSQAAYIDKLCKLTNLHGGRINTPTSPYQSGLPVDSIPDIQYDDIAQKRLTLQMQTIVGLLNWLSVSTCPDIATITSMLAKYCRNPSQAHINAALQVVKYLKGSKHMKLKFSTTFDQSLQSLVQFPLPTHQLSGLCDANWGPQDQSRPKENEKLPELELFKTQSMSGFITWMNGPLMWISKRQTFTA